MNMRQLRAAVVLTSACILAVGCSGGSNQGTKTSTTAPPIAAGALDALLLSPADINTAMGATAMTSPETNTHMVDGSSDVADQDCRVFDEAAETFAYAGSGWTAVRRQDFQEPGDDVAHVVFQVVVSFPSATFAAAFFDASTHRWPACANRKYNVMQPGKLDWIYAVGPISNMAGMLSTTTTLEGGNGWACQRALTVRNNVAVDVLACSLNLPADTAVNIAQKIATKVPT
jgi:PknH-like extracellular domain